MSSCSCGFNPDTPKSVDGKNYANVNKAYDTLTVARGGKFNQFEYFLIIILLFISYRMIKC